MAAFRQLILEFIVRIIARQEIDNVVNAGTLTPELEAVIQDEINNS